MIQYTTGNILEADAEALVEGFETPFGLELLSTVHWLAVHDHVGSPDEIVTGTYAWGERKKQFSDRQIRLALDRLAQGHWLRGLAAGAEG